MTDARKHIDAAKKELAQLQRLAEARAAGRDWVPDNVTAIEFMTSSNYLGLKPFPVQGFLMKVIFGQRSTFTAYDIQLLRELTDGAELVEDEGRRRWHCSRGVSPDLEARLDVLEQQGAPGFREVVVVCGRRFGKSHVGAASILYRIWQIMLLGDPHEVFGIDPDKVLTIPVLSGSVKRAKRDQFRDVVKIISRAPCFRDLIVDSSSGKISLTTPAAVARFGRDAAPVLIEIEAVETTTLAFRGPAIPIAMNDEVAHLVGAGSTSDYADLYHTMVPATAQFGHWSMIWQASSPATKEGQLYENYRRSLAVNVEGSPLEPGMLMIQLESFDGYIDWERAHTIEMWPGGPCYPRKRRALMVYDDVMKEAEASNPETFLVEHRGQWAEVLNSYFSKHFIDDLFGHDLINNAPPVHGVQYFGHGDPSYSQANFGFAIGHQEEIDGRMVLVFDVLHAWRPKDFGDLVIQYEQIGEELYEIAVRYNLAELTFDQFNSASTLQTLQRRLRGRTHVHLRTETHKNNWDAAEAFKSALGQGLIRAPRHTLAESEMRSLQLKGLQRVGPPSSGPTTTCDIADSMIAVHATATNQAKASDIAAQFSAVRPSFGMQVPGRQRPYRPGHPSRRR